MSARLMHRTLGRILAYTAWHSPAEHGLTGFCRKTHPCGLSGRVIYVNWSISISNFPS